MYLTGEQEFKRAFYRNVAILARYQLREDVFFGCWLFQHQHRIQKLADEREELFLDTAVTVYKSDPLIIEDEHN